MFVQNMTFTHQEVRYFAMDVGRRQKVSNYPMQGYMTGSFPITYFVQTARRNI